MADSLQAPAPAPRALRPAEVFIAGRLVGRRRLTTQNGTLFLSLVAMPAPDPYSHPETVELRSSASLGDKDDDVKLICRVGGSRRTFKTTDPDTGEQIVVVTADNRFTVVE